MCKYHRATCDCARPGAHQVCLLDYGCPCEFFTIDDDLFLHNVDRKTLDDYKKLLAGLKKFELPMKKAGQCVKALLDDVIIQVQSDEFLKELRYLRIMDAVYNRILHDPSPEYQPFNEIEMKQEQVVHVCLGDDRHYYFGSVAAIFDTYTPDELGVSLPTLWNHGLSHDRPYINNKCRIYRGTIKRKKQKD